MAYTAVFLFKGDEKMNTFLEETVTVRQVNTLDLSYCEREDMVGVTNHMLDVFTKL